MQQVSASKFEKKTFKTSDGVEISCLCAGNGSKTLIMIPGMWQTALQFHQQIEAFSQTHRVIAMDMRGHGASQKPECDYHIHRMATDVHEMMGAMKVKKASMLGHSMGCCVMWAYHEMFGADCIDKMVMTDQVSCLVSSPAWNPKQTEEAGALFDAASVMGLCAGVMSEQGPKIRADLVKSMFSKDAEPQMVSWCIELCTMMPAAQAASVLHHHAFMDWRQTLNKIRVPTLVTGGEASLFKPRAVQWMAQQIQGARCEIFKASEGGSHMAFMENPTKYNQMVMSFLGK